MNRTAPILMLPLLFLAGCGSLAPGGGAPDTFSLTSPQTAATTGRSARSQQLLIGEPAAVKSIDGDKVVVRTSDTAIQYLAKSQWNDRLPRLVQDGLVQAFEDTGRLGGVGRPGEGLAIDVQLQTDIRTFEVDAIASPVAVVEISAKLVNDRNGVVKAQKVFRQTAPVIGAGNERYADALDTAFKKTVSEIVSWTLSKL